MIIYAEVKGQNDIDIEEQNHTLRMSTQYSGSVASAQIC